MNEINLTKKTRKIRSLTKEHREKISLAHKGKKKAYSFANRKRTIINPIWVKKPVICVNTGQVYESIIKGAKEFYNNKQSANKISEVCRGLKTYYKKDIWRFEKDFLDLSDTEKQDLRNKCIKLNKLYKKYRNKLLFQGITYDCVADLGILLHNQGLLSYRNNTREDLSRLLSTMVGISKKKQCPFVMLKGEYVFFSEYEIVCKDKLGTYKISEKPVDKTVEEVYDYYINFIDKVIGDIKISDLLLSGRSLFFKLDGLYYMSESAMTPSAYDKTIDKATMLDLLSTPNYMPLFKELYDSLDNTTKNKFYIKNNYIFLNKNDYIDRFAIALTKEDVLKDLNIIV